MVKVLVLGATGFLGSLIAKEAVKLGHQVTALVSEESHIKKKQIVDGLKASGVQIKTGSLESDHKDLVDVLKTVEVVGWRPSIWTIGVSLKQARFDDDQRARVLDLQSDDLMSALSL